MCFFVASNEPSASSRLDLCNSGLQTIPEVVLQSIGDVKELLAGQNKLQEIGLKALSQFPQLQILDYLEMILRNFHRQFC
uniref:Uncharacterized protein n=1 Tax=Megaselia scalaris TaxID=36166 RepID=T1GPS6_MEGSC